MYIYICYVQKDFERSGTIKPDYPPTLLNATVQVHF